MELDDIKNIWNKQVTDDHRSEEELEAILKARLKNPMSRIYRSLVLELVILTLLCLSLSYYEYLQGQSIRYFTYILILVIVFPIYWIYYKKVKVEPSRDSFKTTIFKLNRVFKIYKAYLNLCVYGVPFGYIIGILLSTYEKEELVTDSIFWIITIVIGAFTLLLVKPIKWLAHVFYGRHVQDLKDLVKEIKDLESKES